MGTLYIESRQGQISQKGQTPDNSLFPSRGATPSSPSLCNHDRHCILRCNRKMVVQRGVTRPVGTARCCLRHLTELTPGSVQAPDFAARPTNARSLGLTARFHVADRTHFSDPFQASQQAYSATPPLFHDSTSLLAVLALAIRAIKERRNEKNS